MDYLIEMELVEKKSDQQIREEIQQGTYKGDSHRYQIKIKNAETQKYVGINPDFTSNQMNEKDISVMLSKIIERRGVYGDEPNRARVKLVDVSEKAFPVIAATFDFKLAHTLSRGLADERVPLQSQQNNVESPDSYYRQLLGLPTQHTPVVEPPDAYYRQMLGELKLPAPIVESAKRDEVRQAVADQIHTMRVQGKQPEPVKLDAQAVISANDELGRGPMAKFDQVAKKLPIAHRIDPAELPANFHERRARVERFRAKKEAKIATQDRLKDLMGYEGDVYLKEVHKAALELHTPALNVHIAAQRLATLSTAESFSHLLALNMENKPSIALHPEKGTMNIVEQVYTAVEGYDISPRLKQTMQERGQEVNEFRMPRDFFHNTKNEETMYAFGRDATMTVGHYRNKYYEMTNGDMRDSIVESEIWKANNLSRGAMERAHRAEIKSATDEQLPLIRAQHRLESHLYDFYESEWVNIKNGGLSAQGKQMSERTQELYREFQKLNFVNAPGLQKTKSTQKAEQFVPTAAAMEVISSMTKKPVQALPEKVVPQHSEEKTKAKNNILTLRQKSK